MISNVAHSANYVLLIDTCGLSGTLAVAALAPEAHVVAQTALPGRATSERLFPAIRSLLTGCGLELNSLAGLAIIHGPGSFTGIRVGLSAAKGLCESLEIPLTAISRLAVLAQTSSAMEVLALLDAGREEFYCGHYLKGMCLAEKLVNRQGALGMTQAFPDARIVLCEPASAAAFSGTTNVEVVAEPNAASAMALAVRRLMSGEVDNRATIDANYVRRTDVEIFTKQVRNVAGRTCPTQ